jgi:hypothetical protein
MAPVFMVDALVLAIGARIMGRDARARAAASAPLRD